MLTEEEDLNPSSRHISKKFKPPTKEEELEEKCKLWGEMYEKMRKQTDAQQKEFDRMQNRMFWITLCLLGLGIFIGFVLGGIIFG